MVLRKRNPSVHRKIIFSERKNAKQLIILDRQKVRDRLPCARADDADSRLLLPLSISVFRYSMSFVQYSA